MIEMQQLKLSELHQHNTWEKRVLRTYWIVITMHAALQLLSFALFTYDRTPADFWINVIVVPSLIMSASVLLSEWIFSRLRRFMQPALLLGATIIATVIVYTNADIRIITAAFLIPILSSIIYYKVRSTLYVLALQLAAFFSLYTFSLEFRSYFSVFDLIAIPCFFSGGALVSAIIIIRAQELALYLQETLQAKQELMVQNIVMDRLSKTDALTGLYNHISFHDYLDGAMQYVQKGGSLHLALLDIDNFKSINDRYGHRTGDQVLSIVAGVIRANVGGSDLAARYGGEEFAFLLFEHSQEDVYKLLEHIREQIAASELDTLLGERVTVSIGVKHYEHGMTKEALFEAADALLYKAKYGGKNKTESA